MYSAYQLFKSILQFSWKRATWDSLGSICCHYHANRTCGPNLSQVPSDFTGPATTISSGKSGQLTQFCPNDDEIWFKERPNISRPLWEVIPKLVTVFRCVHKQVRGQGGGVICNFASACPLSSQWGHTGHRDLRSGSSTGPRPNPQTLDPRTCNSSNPDRTVTFQHKLLWQSYFSFTQANCQPFSII